MSFPFLQMSLASGLALLGLVLVGLAALWPKRTQQLQEPTIHDPGSHIFVFDKRELVGASPEAEDALSEEDLEEDVFYQLLSRLGVLFPEIESYVDGIEENGNPVELLEVTRDGPVALKMSRDNGQLTMSVSGLPAPLSRTVLVDEDQVAMQQAEVQFLRSVNETSPVPSWREDSNGTIDWVNPAYSDLVQDSTLSQSESHWPPVRLFGSGKVSSIGEEPRPRRSAIKMEDGSTRMYETVSIGCRDNTLHYALDATATALAEDSLRNFLQTLTQTFAYLPIGLMIFDRARHLVMFNPALLDLTSLQPAWLSARPTLYDVLNALREKRMVPERKDFCDWRKQMIELEKSAKDGTFSETWTLPNGQIYRVTGRPHPEGAIAFLIEDISSEMTLKRKFRRELDMQYSILDNLADAVLVFDRQGCVQAVNDPFCELWSAERADLVGKYSAQDMMNFFRENCQPHPMWGDLKDFIHQRSDRASWSSTIHTLEGQALTCRMAPLQGGATLVTFTEPVTMRMPRTLIRDKAPSSVTA